MRWATGYQRLEIQSTHESEAKKNYLWCYRQDTYPTRKVPDLSYK